ncbi:MAG: DUF3108 domain-containing protein [Tepidamorphaceae bacterium]|nr:DUF3108 domain-containing protein [Rhodobiaceae bacterium]
MANESALFRMRKTFPLWISSKQTRKSKNRILGAIACAAALVFAPLPAAQAAKDGYFAVSYSVALGGLPLGKGNFSGRVGGGAYRLKGDAMLTGIAGWLFDYKAYGEVDGHLGGDNHSPRKFRSSASDDRSTQIVSMRFSGSRVKDMEISPPVIPDKQHVTVKAGHMRGVVDPMTAMIITSTGKNGALKPSDCNRKIPVFNGRERFDLVLRFKGTSQVSGNRRNTYNGPVIVCQALYRPIAGHRKNREEIDYYVNQKNLEVWLAPAGNTGLLVPVRMVVPTPIGTGVISATGFAASYDGVKHTSATQ